MIFCLDAPSPFAPPDEQWAFLESIKDLPQDDPMVQHVIEKAYQAIRRRAN